MCLCFGIPSSSWWNIKSFEFLLFTYSCATKVDVDSYPGWDSLRPSWDCHMWTSWRGTTSCCWLATCWHRWWNMTMKAGDCAFVPRSWHASQDETSTKSSRHWLYYEPPGRFMIWYGDIAEIYVYMYIVIDSTKFIELFLIFYHIWFTLTSPSYKVPCIPSLGSTLSSLLQCEALVRAWIHNT